MYIVIQNGLQYNAHDSGYSNKQDKEKGNRGGGGKKKMRDKNEWKQDKNHHFLDYLLKKVLDMEMGKEQQ